ncbi:MerR family DNA-binding transcriptional regulator [Pontibacillus salicampi]|uniref:MerR family DNA-binding transcriptional regulator n=1 Tax=Pontibacillus salicampi TaxID=1449801 RepID=A0ABV6LSU8_9BACI
MGEWSISELAEEFVISTRTIRYYEELGLLAPKRSNSGHRIYSKKERTRLMLIFRGKKYGFTLQEIREMVQLFDKDPSGVKQLEKTIEYGEVKVREVSDRIQDLTDMKQEMEQVLDQLREKLHSLQ